MISLPPFLMRDSYLDTLDDLLATGIEGLGRSFVDAQMRFVLAQQEPDGGFRGRLGGSDLYYTDFAMRILALLAPTSESGTASLPAGRGSPGQPTGDSGGAAPSHAWGNEAIQRVAASLSGHAGFPDDLVASFNVLNTERLLRRCGMVAAIEPAEVGARVLEHMLPQGGFARAPEGDQVSAYHTFLAELCLQSMQMDMPRAGEAVSAIAALRCPDGGFAEMPGQPQGQTSATAAATAFLSLHDALGEDTGNGVAGFLVSMQSPVDGGLKAHATASSGDLLSTFTGLLTLWGLGETDRPDFDLAAVARFVRATASPTGGFRACPADSEADVEYTYYGIGTLAVLRMAAARGTGASL